eukprot:6180988-Pleurochrysis_carterae.AAC.3
MNEFTSIEGRSSPSQGHLGMTIQAQKGRASAPGRAIGASSIDACPPSSPITAAGANNET